MIKKSQVSLGLTILGVIGVPVTSWLSIRCNKKAEKETEKKKKILAYVPAIASGIGTAGCILGSHHVSKKEIAALTATCTFLTANRDKIEEKIKEHYGEDALNDIKKEANIDTVVEKHELEKKANKRVSIEDSGYGDVHFVEYCLGREFYCSLERVEWAEKELNRRFHEGEYVCMNDWYELLGIRGTSTGWQFGWPANEDFFDYNIDEPIMFDNILGEDEDGSLLYMIDVRTSPIDCWMEL